MTSVVNSRDNSFDLARGMMLGALVLSLLVGVGVAITRARSITSSVKAVQVTLTAMADECVTSIERGLAAMAAGDLTVEAPIQPTVMARRRPGPWQVGERVHRPSGRRAG